MRPDILSDIWLRDRQIWFFLGISESTWYRKKREWNWNQAEIHVLKSLATGLPVSVASSRMWLDHYFDTKGALRGPSRYPIEPGDLWVYEFMMKNGVVWKNCDHYGIPKPHEVREWPEFKRMMVVK